MPMTPMVPQVMAATPATQQQQQQQQQWNQPMHQPMGSMVPRQPQQMIPAGAFGQSQQPSMGRGRAAGQAERGYREAGGPPGCIRRRGARYEPLRDEQPQAGWGCVVAGRSDRAVRQGGWGHGAGHICRAGGAAWRRRATHCHRLRFWRRPWHNGSNGGWGSMHWLAVEQWEWWHLPGQLRRTAGGGDR
eukprot:COSAG01_NODE_32007_length_587_cov_11.278689_1_plen_188_part_01